MKIDETSIQNFDQQWLRNELADILTNLQIDQSMVTDEELSEIARQLFKAWKSQFTYEVSSEKCEKCGKPVPLERRLCQSCWYGHIAENA